MQIFSPSFFSIAVFESFLQFFKTFPNLKKVTNMFQYNTPFYNFSQEIVFTGFYLIFYIVWVLISFFLGKKSGCCNKKCYEIFMETIYLIFTFVNNLISIFIFFNIFSFNGGFLMLGPLMYILIFIWIVPFFLSLALSFKSAFYYIIYSLPFFINIAQYISFVPTFAFSRLNDLSWGNRESRSVLSVNKQYSFLFITIQLNILIVIINIVITVLYIYLIKTLGRNEYVYSVFFIILFSSVIFQILFTVLYFCKLIFKGCMKQIRNGNDNDTEYSDKVSCVGSSTGVIKSVNNSSII